MLRSPLGRLVARRDRDLRPGPGRGVPGLRTIFRTDSRAGSSCIIARALLENERPSWAARGVLGYLLARPGDSRPGMIDLCRRGDLGCDALRRILREMETFGYLRRVRFRDVRGRLCGAAHLIRTRVPRE